MRRIFVEILGISRGGRSVRNRDRVRSVIGHEAERLVARYETFSWTSKTRCALTDNLALLDQIDRTVVLIRLANDLEGHLACGILYCSNAIQRENRLKKEGELKIDLAKRLGFPKLGDELRRVYQENAKTQILEVFQNHSSHKNGYTIIPLSFRRRFRIGMYQTVASAVYRFRSALRRRRRLIFDR